MINTGFHDPIKDIKPKAKKSPWNFIAPPYDQRSGCFVEAGDDHGLGYKQPVGHSGNPKQHCDTLPFGRPKGRKVDYVNRSKFPYQLDITEDGE